MSYLKSILFTFLVLTGLLFSYIFFKFDANYMGKLTSDAYLEQDYKKASKYLDSIETKPVATLYKGYLLRVEKDFKGSNDAFLACYHNPKLEKYKHEAELNLLLNSYLVKDFKKLNEDIKSVSSDGFFHFYSGILSFNAKDYSKALEHYEQSEITSYPSKCFEADFKNTFSKSFKDYQSIFSQLEIGHIESARQNLEPYIQKTRQIDYRFHYLMGKSYLIESSDKPLKLASAYYQSAFEYLHKIPFWQIEYQNIKADVSQSFEKALGQLLDAKLYSELDHFVTWTAHFEPNLDTLTSLFTKHIALETQINNPEAFNELSKQVLSYCRLNELKQKLSQSLYMHMLHLMDHKQIDPMHKTWQIYHQITDDTTQAKEQVSKFIIEMLKEAKDIEQFNNLLIFFETLKLDPLSKELFFKQMMPLLEELWVGQAPLAYDVVKTLEALVSFDEKDAFNQLMQESITELLDQKGFVKSEEIEKAFNHFNTLMKSKL